MMKFSLPREAPKRPKQLAEQEAGRTLSRSSPWSRGHVGATGWGTRWLHPTPFPSQGGALLTRLPPARSPTQGLCAPHGAGMPRAPCSPERNPDGDLPSHKCWRRANTPPPPANTAARRGCSRAGAGSSWHPLGHRHGRFLAVEIGLKKNEALEAASRKGLGLQTAKSKRNAAPKPPLAHFGNLLSELRGDPGRGRGWVWG